MQKQVRAGGTGRIRPLTSVRMGAPMELIRKIPFSYEDEPHEIRVLTDNKIINIVAFHRNRPANGFRYHVQIPGHIQPKQALEAEPLREMIERSKNDIYTGRWEKMREYFTRAEQEKKTCDNEKRDV